MSLFNKELLEKIQSKEPVKKKHTILIVDDEKYNLATLSDMLSDEYDVLSACDGRDALELIQNHPEPEQIHLILCDQRMPGMTGSEFLEKSISIIPDAVRIILTAYTDVEAIIGAVNNARIYKFILKPFEKNELMQTIQRALESYELKQINKSLVQDLKNLNAGLENEIKVSVRELEDERDKSRMYFNMAGVIMIVIDSQCKVALINRKGCEILGYTEEEIVGKNWIDAFIHEYEKKEVRVLFEKMINGKSKDFEYYENNILSNEKGKRLIAWYNTLLRNENGEITGTLSSGEDITEKRKAEKSLRSAHEQLECEVRRRTSELVKINAELISEIQEHKRTEAALQEKQMQLAHAGRLASLGEMATGMAHELNQPLSLIRLCCESMRFSLKKFDHMNPVYDEKLDCILRAVDRAVTTIEHMRGFARTRKIFHEKVDLLDTINKSLTFFTEQFRHNEIALETDYEENLPYITADSQQLEQVVVNFLSNARYAVDKRGKTGEKDYEKQIKLRLFHDKIQNILVFEIEDNGIGMTREEKDRCIEPFFTTKDIGEGTGLGLSIAHGIINELNGKMEVESEKGKGTVMRIMMQIEG